MKDLLQQLKTAKSQKEWDDIDIDSYEGTPFYVIEENELINCHYIKRIKKPFVSYQGLTVQYYVNKDIYHSYTIGSRSGNIGERFQTDEVKVALSFKKIHPTYVLEHLQDPFTKEFIIRVINENPEYFI